MITRAILVLERIVLLIIIAMTVAAIGFELEHFPIKQDHYNSLSRFCHQNKSAYRRKCIPASEPGPVSRSDKFFWIPDRCRRMQEAVIDLVIQPVRKML